MTIRNLDKLMDPASVVVIGASPAPHSVGQTIAANVLSGGFTGRVMLVNPRYREIDGQPCYASVAALPAVADLAIIATPPETLTGLVADLAAHRTKAAVIITAGVTPELRLSLLEAGRAQCFRVLGPNGIGLLRPTIGLNASFVHRSASAGKLAFLSQSGALVTAVIDWAASRDIGFSHIVSVGDMADIDFGDLLDHLAADPACAAILMYIEGITHAPKFISAARRAARAKPVIALKAGRHAAGARAAFSHTGALAGSDAAYDTAFERCGIVRVNDLEALFDAAALLSAGPALRGERLAILTNGGGAGVLAADRLIAKGGRLSELSAATVASLSAVLPATWSHGNPVDIIGDADAERYASALVALLTDEQSDAVLVLNCPTALHANTDIARAVTATAAASKAIKPVLTAWLGADAAADARDHFRLHAMPTFETPASAIGGFMHLVNHRRAQASLMRTPPRPDEAQSIDRAAVDRLLATVLREGRRELPDQITKAMLAAYGIPVVDAHVARAPDDVRLIAGTLLRSHSAVVVKILSDQISHKSDVGGVMLGLTSADAAANCAKDMHDRIDTLRPDARLDGFTVSPFIVKPRAHELIMGIVEDATFGPMILFGAGGTSVEVTRDTALALPPLDILLARDLIAKTRIAALLAGYRDRPAADTEAIALALVRLSALAANHPEIRELDINPVLADVDGILALDARMRIADATSKKRQPLAIRPYPSQWQFTEQLRDVGLVHIRPVRPDDERLYAKFFAAVTPADRRMRFLGASKAADHTFLARLTQIDYAREIAFVALSHDRDELLGVCRFVADPNLEDAEFAILVRSDLKGKGLGWRLMHLLLDYARAEGITALRGSVLEENNAMLRMCRELGFTQQTVMGDPGVVHVTLRVSQDALLPVGLATQSRN
jgi:acetyltransferase